MGICNRASQLMQENHVTKETAFKIVAAQIKSRLNKNSSVVSEKKALKPASRIKQASIPMKDLTPTETLGLFGPTYSD